MPATAQPAQVSSDVRVFNYVNEVLINAPIDIVFETVLLPMGPLANMSLKLEPWPGGRWYRDLGNNAGHFWGHVQVIKPPKLLEITGPMMMSYPVSGFLQYRLTEEPSGTRLKLTHQAVGLLNPEHTEHMPRGWGEVLEGIQKSAESRASR
jgi:uncharacterized protein YndB with AHSA1/START domain